MRPTPNDVHVVWLDRVQIDHSIDAHDIDVIRALCEVCEPPLTVARLFELLEREQDETVRRGLVEVIRQRAARGEGREVAECYVRMMLQRGAHTLTAERVAEAVGVSLRVAGEVLMEYARGGVVRTRVSGRRVTVYRLQPAEGGQVSGEPVHWEDSACGQVSVNPVQPSGQVSGEPVQAGDSACGQVSVNPVQPSGQVSGEPVQAGDSACGQVSGEPVHWEDSACGQVSGEPVHWEDSACGQVSVNPVQPSGQVSCEPVHWEDSACGQVSVNPVQPSGQVSCEPVQVGDSACGQVSVNPVQPSGQVSCEPVQVGDSACGQVSVNPVQPSGQVSGEPVHWEDSACGAGGCDHNLLEVVSALQATPKLLVHTAARLVSNYRDVPMCAACDEIRRMLVLVRDEASAEACIARARGLLAQVACAEGARQEQPDQYRLDGLYTERELGWIPHILEFVESRKRVLPFYVALHLRDKLRLSRKEMEAVQDLVWRMASSGDAGLRLVGAMVERVPLAREEAG
jgi:hypothetical protein